MRERHRPLSSKLTVTQRHSDRGFHSRPFNQEPTRLHPTDSEQAMRPGRSIMPSVLLDNVARVAPASQRGRIVMYGETRADVRPRSSASSTPPTPRCPNDRTRTREGLPARRWRQMRSEHSGSPHRSLTHSMGAPTRHVSLRTAADLREHRPSHRRSHGKRAERCTGRRSRQGHTRRLPRGARRTVALRCSTRSPAGIRN